MRKEIEELIVLWDARHDVKHFIKQIKKRGWICLGLSCKYAFEKDGVDFVVKFDPDGQKDDTTAYEARQYERAKPHKKKYLAKTIIFHRGLLIQERLPIVCDHKVGCRLCQRARTVASELRILDWPNHGEKNGRLRFFDTDSMGSGWFNWRRKRKSRTGYE